MGDFKVHHVRFFEYEPCAIHSISYDDASTKLAVARSEGSIEIWSTKDHLFQEKILPPIEDGSVETLVWCRGRLFSAGLHGDIHEHDLTTLGLKYTVSANSGAVWCMALNQSKTHIAVGTENGCVVLFEVTENGLEFYKSLDRQEGRILSLAWYEPEKVIVTGGLDNIRIWSIKSGHAIQRLSPGRQERNRETIVWTIAVANDFTIVSGDSRGKVCFWNGRHGTQIKAIQSHKADVLSLCTSPDGNTVYASGVEPIIAQFEFTPVKADSDWKMWIRSAVWTRHSHDVRAVIYAKDCVVSGGVDCQLIFSYVEGKRNRMFKKFPAIPHEPLVSTAGAKNMLLLRYRSHIDVWRLGSTEALSDQSGETLPLSSDCIKVLELKCKGDGYITCATISDNGQWIAYCDSNKPKLFYLTMEGAVPKLKKVKYIPAEIQPSRRMCFSADSSKLLLAACDGSVQVIKVDDTHPEVVYTFGSLSDPAESIHLLSTNAQGTYMATADHCSNIHVYDLQHLKHVCTLPKHYCQPSAMAFHPTQPLLIVTYTDQKIFEYSITQGEYTDWSRYFNKAYHQQWMQRTSKFSQVMYSPHKPNHIFLRDEQMLCIINKSQPLPNMAWPLFAKDSWKMPHKQQDVNHCIHVCNKYKYLLHMDILPDNSLVIVERPPSALLEGLPPTLKLKKFGT